MPIVIDINCLACVFDVNNQEHVQFSDILRWIQSGKGVFVFGGTEYQNELKKCPKYIPIILELLRSNKAVRILDSEVDSFIPLVRQLISATKCNDSHIIALVLASHCPLLCTNDIALMAAIKIPALYHQRGQRVRIYRSAKNRLLLNRHSDRSVLKNCT